MKMKRAPRLLVYISFAVLSTLPWSCLEDHLLQTVNELRLINCRSGWKPVGVYAQGSRIGDAAPGFQKIKRMLQTFQVKTCEVNLDTGHLSEVW
jgi:hypothetical protein